MKLVYEMKKSGRMTSLVPLTYVTYRGPEGSGTINTDTILLIKKEVLNTGNYPENVKITVEIPDDGSE